MARLMKRIDLRSDTVTSLSEKMMQRMITAEVGDDVYGEDTTVNQLEKKAADLFGKEAAVLVPTGTMGNLASILTHCSRGESVVIGDKSHINLYEQGGISGLGGVFPSCVKNLPNGTYELEDALNKIYPENEHFPKAKAIVIENTHNVCGGKVISQDFHKQVLKLAEENNLKVHIDGARIWNAYYYYKQDNPEITLKDITKGDSLEACFSKALRCPLGSIIVGTDEFIRRARRWRKALGGGMRQAGYIAATALDALDEIDEIMKNDHMKARKLTKGLRELGCDVEEPMTNIVNLKAPEGFSIEEFSTELAKMGVLIPHRPWKDNMRAVPHSNISDEDIEEALEVIGNLVNRKK